MALIHSTAQFTVDEALRGSVTELKEKVVAQVRHTVEVEGLGISIDDALLQTIPPRQVKQAFAAVISAEQDRGKSLNEAQGYANSLRNSAEGEATKHQDLKKGRRPIKQVCDATKQCCATFRDIGRIPCATTASR